GGCARGLRLVALGDDHLELAAELVTLCPQAFELLFESRIRAEGSLRCRRGGEGWRGSRRGGGVEGRGRNRSGCRTFRGFLPLFDAIEGDEEVDEVQVLVVAARGGRVGKERFVGRVGRRLQLLEIEAGPGEARRTSCLRVRRV